MPTKNYKVEWIEKRNTSTGKLMAKVSLSDETGAHFTDVTVWSDFPNFADLGPGSSVQGDIVEKGQYKTLYPTKAPRASGGATGGGMRGIAAAQTRKAENIDHAQDRKEFGIQVASTMANSVLITNELLRGQEFSLEEYSTVFEKTRKWFINQWKNTEEMVDIASLERPTPKI